MKFICTIWMMSCFFCSRLQAQGLLSSFSPQTVINTESLFMLSLSVSKANTVSLSWQFHPMPPHGSYFSIERSSNHLHYESIATLKATLQNMPYSYTDESPGFGNCSYRIRLIHEKTIIASVTKPVLLTGTAIHYKFYPNPVGNMLLVNMEEQCPLQIIDPAGTIKLSMLLMKGINAIDCSHLPKGNYLIKFLPSPNGRGFTDQLIKN